MSIGKMALGLLLAASASQATVIVNDTFENGPGVGETSTRANDAFDAQDVAWYMGIGNPTLGVANDSFAGGSSARAFSFAIGGVDSFRRVGANFSAASLAIGEKIILSLDMRFTEAPATNAIGFRVGLHNSNGTVLGADQTSTTVQAPQETNDVGYYMRIATGSASGAINELVREPAGNNPLGGATTGGSGDGATVLNAAASPAVLGDQLKHTLLLSIERTATSTLAIQGYVDGVLKLSSTDSAALTSAFDMVYVGNGGTVNDFNFDNVKIEVVPEPATIGLLAMSGLMLGRRRRA